MTERALSRLGQVALEEKCVLRSELVRAVLPAGTAPAGLDVERRAAGDWIIGEHL